MATLQRQYGFEYDPTSELAALKSLLPKLKPMVTDTAFFINDRLGSGKTLLAEGANAALLDIDHGTYPFVTSSSTSAGGIYTGLGVAPSLITGSIGVVKAYTTRVGSGPFPSELTDEVGERLRKIGGEFGTTTGRPRRCGWLDIPVVQYSHMLNNYTSINITKLDVLTGLNTIKMVVAYTLDGVTLKPGQMPGLLEDLARVKPVFETFAGWQDDISKVREFEKLPLTAQKYLKRVEELIGVKITWVGVGPGRVDMATQGFHADVASL